MRRLGHALFAGLRDAAWLTPARARVWLLALVLALLGALGRAVFFSTGWLHPVSGAPLGGDFLAFWSASHLLQEGRWAEVYDAAAVEAVQLGLFPGFERLGLPFVNPPPALLVFLPLALLPYGGSLVGFLVLTFAAYAAAVRRLAPAASMGLAILAFPGAWLSVSYGQNGTLSAAMLAAGVASLRSRPVLAGICFGCLVYKPQLALVVPFALAAGGDWRALAATAATALAWVLASAAFFGPGAWLAWMEVSGGMRVVLENGHAGFHRVVSVFAMLRQAGVSIGGSYAGQAAVALPVLCALVLVLRRRPAGGAAGSLLVAATPLVTPYVLEYDLAILAVPLAWMTQQGLREGFLPWEKTGLLLVYALPLAAATQLFALAGIQAMPLAIGLLFGLVARRALLPGDRVVLPRRAG